MLQPDQWPAGLGGETENKNNSNQSSSGSLLQSAVNNAIMSLYEYRPQSVQDHQLVPVH